MSQTTASSRHSIARQKKKFHAHDHLANDDPHHANTNSVYPKDLVGIFG